MVLVVVSSAVSLTAANYSVRKIASFAKRRRTAATQGKIKARLLSYSHTADMCSEIFILILF